MPPSYRTFFNATHLMYLRSLLFNLFFPVWTLCVCLGFSPLLFGTPKSLAVVGYIWAKGTAIGLRLLCGIRMEIRGREYLPANSVYVIASKHQSAWETFVFHILCNKPVYVLKKELTRLPFFGYYLVRMGMICIDRSGKASTLKELIKQSNVALAEARPIIIFPEGSRITPGEKVAYHPGVAAIYSQSHAPVVPVALNSGLCWGKNAFFKKPGKIVLEFLPPIEPGLKRDEFMQHLEKTIEEASEKLMIEGKY